MYRAIVEELAAVGRAAGRAPWPPTWWTRVVKAAEALAPRRYSSLHHDLVNGKPARAGGAARSRRPSRPAARVPTPTALAVYAALKPHAATGARPARTPRLTSAGSRAVWRYVAPVPARYAVGIVCLVARHRALAGDSVDGQAGHRRAAGPGAAGAARPLRGRDPPVAVGNGVARLVSRFTIIGAPSGWSPTARPPLRRRADLPAWSLRPLLHRRPHGARGQRREHASARSWASA